MQNLKQFTCYAGETKALVVEIENEQEGSEVGVAFVRGQTVIKKSFSTKDGTLVKEEDGCYHCELSESDTLEMGVATFVIEVKVESPTRVLIRPAGLLEIKRDQAYQL